MTELQALTNDDLKELQGDIIQERIIRQIMAETEESREVVTEAIDAIASMGQEAVLELTDGVPTTLEDALRRYVEELEDTNIDGDDLQSIVTNLGAILNFPYQADPWVHLCSYCPEKFIHPENARAHVRAMHTAGSGNHHHVQLTGKDAKSLYDWLGADGPSGSWNPNGTDRVTVEAVENGGILIITRPYRYSPSGPVSDV